jgi:cephalosporin hydroxylase
MKLIIDIQSQTLTRSEAGQEQQVPLHSDEAFEMLSREWVSVGWYQKYVYTFSWLGRPIIQMPEDMVRTQEVIYGLQPDLIIETGVAHGGSLIFYASLCKMIGRGRVVGIDIEIRPHNRAAIEEHAMHPLITLIEGSSVDPTIVEQVRNLVQPGEKVLVLLDSNHSKSHVLAELDAYASLVTPGSYIVATDGVMEQVAGGPRTQPEWAWDNPSHAAREWVQRNPDFEIEEPAWLFNESTLRNRITHWPNAFIKRLR